VSVSDLATPPLATLAKGDDPMVTDAKNWRALLAATTEATSQPARICELCADQLDISGAGLSMITPVGARGIVCATDEVSALLEDLQFTLGEGPCFDAARWGSPILIADLEQPEDLAIGRWPTFVDGALSAGVRALFVFPLRVGAISVGALDLYRNRVGDLTRADYPAALMAAEAAAHALLRLEVGQAAIFSDNPDTKVGYQFQIHQATGMVQVQLGVTTEEALVRLRARAFALGRPLVDVATDVVERRLRFTAEDE
jgi:ANTAR domain-containing protein/GAF domain-containing protein